jgi:dTDP-4-dehydrorhamnose 3,5-epimerase
LDEGAGRRFMILEPMSIVGAFLVELEPIEDHRGFFARAWSRDEFAMRDLCTDITHLNVSYNARQGTLRGMHWQSPPHAEAKLVRCVAGAVYDVIADTRADSESFGRWQAVELSAENRRSLYVPPYVAHGFQTLTDGAELFYAMSSAYVETAARGFRWDDPTFAIEWPPAEERILAERDRSYPDFTPAGAEARSAAGEG